MSWGFYFSGVGVARDGGIGFDVAAPYVGRVTRLYVDNLDRDGSYVRTIMLAQLPGSPIYLEGAGSAYASLTVADKPIAHAGSVEIPVVCSDASAEPFPAGPVEAMFNGVTGGHAAPRAASPPDPDLVTLETAKRHLQITDTDHDTDVQEKLTAASAIIRDYLKGKNDPTWTAADVPPVIAAAVLLMLAHLYEHRGDEFGQANDNDDRVWSAIGNLLIRSRDPALA